MLKNNAGVAISASFRWYLRLFGDYSEYLSYFFSPKFHTKISSRLADYCGRVQIEVRLCNYDIGDFMSAGGCGHSV